MTFRVGVVALVAGVLVPAAARAGSISISISPAIELRDSLIAAHVEVKNSGDEAAHTVSPVLRFRGKELRGPARERLEPNQSMTADLSLPAADLTPGRWPYGVAVDYTDGNQYPFQALHMASVTLGNPPPAKLSVAEVRGEPLATSGSLRVRLKNLAGTPRQTSVHVVVPEGVEVTQPEQSLSLAAWEEGSLSVPLVNRTALAGSRYPVFITAEYDDDGVHQAVIGQGMLEITNPRSFFQSNRQLFLIAAVLAVAVWAGAVGLMQLKYRRRRAIPPL